MVHDFILNACIYWDICKVSILAIVYRRLLLKNTIADKQTKKMKVVLF